MASKSPEFRMSVMREMISRLLSRFAAGLCMIVLLWPGLIGRLHESRVLRVHV